MKNIPFIILLSCFSLLFIEGVSAQLMKELVKEEFTANYHHRFMFLTIDYLEVYAKSQSDDPVATRTLIGNVNHPDDFKILDSVYLKYDDSGNLTYRETIRNSNGEWIPSSRVTYLYHNDSKPKMWESELFRNGMWGKSHRWIYEYNSQGNLISEKDYYFRTTTNEWEVITIYSYEYDGEGNQVRYLRQVRHYDEMVDYREMINTYDDRNNKIELNIEEEQIGKWRILFEYDDNDNLTLRESQKWENDTWVPKWKKILKYDNQWEDVASVVFHIKRDSSEFEPHRKYEMEYDNQGRLINTFLSLWTPDSSNYRPEAMYSIVFDDENNTATLEDADYYPHAYAINTTYVYEFSNDGNIAYYSRELNYYFGKRIVKYFYDTDGPNTSTRELESISLSIFPNPASDYVLIEWGEIEAVGIELYDSNGRLLMSDYPAPGSKAYNLRLEGYSAGMYTVLLRDKQGKVATERVLITND